MDASVAVGDRCRVRAAPRDRRRVGADQCTEQLAALNEAGMDGMIMGLVDFNEELKFFGSEVMPRMVQAGIRHD